MPAHITVLKRVVRSNPQALARRVLVRAIRGWRLAILDALLAESYADNLAHAAGIYATSLTKRGVRAWFALAMGNRR